MDEGLLLGVSAALCFAATDACAALAARSVQSAKIVFLAQCSACFALLCWVGLAWQPVLDGSFLLSMVLGLLSTISVRAMYAALAEGILAIVSPLLRCSSAITVVFALLILHQHIIELPLCLIFGGVLALTTPINILQWQKPDLRWLGCAITAMLGLGSANVLLGLPTVSLNIWTVSRLWTLVFLVAWEWKNPLPRCQVFPSERPGRGLVGWRGASLSGVAEIGGLVCYRAASQMLPLAISAMLVSLYSGFSRVYWHPFFA